MKVKKELKKANDKINNQILEEGQEVYDKLMLENSFNGEKEINFSTNVVRVTRLAWILPVCTVLLIVLSLSIILPIVLKEDDSLEYKEYCQKAQDITVNDINSEFTTFQIDNVDFTSECSEVYDKKHNDTLYYKVNMISLNNNVNGSLYIVVNKNYAFNERYNGEKIVETYKNYPLTYTMTLNDANMNCFGCLEIEGTKVYFEFSGAAEVYTTPTQFLDQVLIIK